MNDSNQLTPEEVVWIGRNDHDYTFGVCRFGHSWLGFGRGELPPPDAAMIFFFPFEGLADRGEVIKKTVAFAFYPESGYGGISQWAPEFINDEEIQTARASDFTCSECDEPFCDGDCGDDYDYY